MNERRRLLKLGLATGLCALSGRLYAAPPASPRLLVVFLRGGYDCCNFLVPYSSEFYAEARPHIAIPRPGSENESGALALDADWALAPSVRTTLGALYDRGQVAFVPFAGTEDTSRSHFETQDGIELGQPTGARGFHSGYLGRLSEVLTDRHTGAAAIAFTDALPLAFEGRIAVPNLSLKNSSKSRFDDRQAQWLNAMYTGHHLQSAVSGGLALRREVASEMVADPAEMTAAYRNAIGTRGFELEAERMAHLMRSQYRIGFVDVGGWDTHVGQGGAQGRLADNLANVAAGLDGFARTLGEEWHNTVVVVLSEFGRTFRENGNHGTDHGHGTTYWVLGGALNGGRIVGEQRRLTRATLFQDRDLPVLNEYRAVLGGLFRSLWGLSRAQSAHIFEGAAPLDLGLV